MPPRSSRKVLQLKNCDRSHEKKCLAFAWRHASAFQFGRTQAALNRSQRSMALDNQIFLELLRTNTSGSDINFSTRSIPVGRAIHPVSEYQDRRTIERKIHPVVPCLSALHGMGS